MRREGTKKNRLSRLFGKKSSNSSSSTATSQSSGTPTIPTLAIPHASLEEKDLSRGRSLSVYERANMVLATPRTPRPPETSDSNNEAAEDPYGNIVETGKAGAQKITAGQAASKVVRWEVFHTYGAKADIENQLETILGDMESGDTLKRTMTDEYSIKLNETQSQLERLETLANDIETLANAGIQIDPNVVKDAILENTDAIKTIANRLAEMKTPTSKTAGTVLVFDSVDGYDVPKRVAAAETDEGDYDNAQKPSTATTPDLSTSTAEDLYCGPPQAPPMLPAVKKPAPPVITDAVQADPGDRTPRRKAMGQAAPPLTPPDTDLSQKAAQTAERSKKGPLNRSNLPVQQQNTLK